MINIDWLKWLFLYYIFRVIIIWTACI